MSVGIDQIGYWPCTGVLSLRDLAAFRGADPDYPLRDLRVLERSVVAPWEDPVTMAVQAGLSLVTEDNVSDIGLLIVGTETAVDMEKPLSSWVHRFLGLPSTCRNFEIKHACYAGSASLQMALCWLATQKNPNAKALVICSDHALHPLHQPWEYVMGAGSVALLLSKSPRLLEIDIETTGVHAAEVTDVIRPTCRIETGNSELSLLSYLDAVEGTMDAWDDQVDVNFAEHFAGHIYHAPFGEITFRAHRVMLQRSGSTVDARADFERRSAPALTYTRRTGGVYGGTVFCGLLALIAEMEPSPGERIGIFSYGSGSCAEFYTGTVQTDAVAIARSADAISLLDARRVMSISEYELLEEDRRSRAGARHWQPAGFEDWYASHFEGQKRLVLRGINNYVRDYGWS